MPSHRTAHYLLLVAITSLLTFPNLGAHALWDMDEGVNTECTREMLEAGTWIVPTFNWELRTAKPIMMYWLQRFSFLAFGVDEWAARLPSVLLGIGTVLLTYELGRRMFDARTGLLGGVALASAIQFSVLSHAATPDAPLIFFHTLMMVLFWVGHANGGRWWFVPAAAASGLAVLSKGPLFLALPWVVVGLYFLWNRELRRVLDWRLLWGGVAFLLVAAPWYVVVTTETHGDWLRGFVFDHNVNRFETPMESHGGPVVYYVGALILLFAPWSNFLAATLWYGVKAANGRREPAGVAGADQVAGTDPSHQPAHASRSPEVRAHRFLVVWFAAYLVFFSLAATKLPNYIGPLYPAIALLTARFLTRWWSGELALPRWVMPAGTVGMFVTGLVIAAGLLVCSGLVATMPPSFRVFPGLEEWAWIGIVPVAAAGVMGWFLRTGNRGGFVAATAAGSVAVVALLMAGPPLVVDRFKSPKDLVAMSGTRRPDREIRLASFGYFQESLVFYAERRVQRTIEVPLPTAGGPPKSVHRPMTADDAAEFLALPQPSYLFVSKQAWEEQVRPRVAVPVRVAATKYDFLRNTDVLVVTNELTP